MKRSSLMTILAIACCMSPPAARAQGFHYDTQLLPLTGTFNASEAVSIRTDSNSVMIAGDLYRTADSIRIPVVWERPVGSGGPWTVTQLPVLTPGGGALPTDMPPTNLATIVVGSAREAGGNLRAVFWERPGTTWNLSLLPLPEGSQASKALGAWRSLDDPTRPTYIAGWAEESSFTSARRRFPTLCIINNILAAVTVQVLPGLVPNGEGTAYSVEIASDQTPIVFGWAADSLGQHRPVMWKQSAHTSAFAAVVIDPEVFGSTVSSILGFLNWCEECDGPCWIIQYCEEERPTGTFLCPCISQCNRNTGRYEYLRMTEGDCSPWDFEEGEEFPHLRSSASPWASTVVPLSVVGRMPNELGQFRATLWHTLFSREEPDIWIEHDLNDVSQGVTLPLVAANDIDQTARLVGNAIASAPFRHRAFIGVPASGPETGVGMPPATPGLLTLQAHPNPFARQVSISYRTNADGMVSLTIHDVTGREVATLVQGFQPAGSYSSTWHGVEGSTALAPGVYMVRLWSANETVTQKLIITP